MGYIIKDTQGLVITRLTDVGRRKISQGNFNISYFQVGDSEINYSAITDYDQAEAMILEPAYNAHNNVGVPQSTKNNVKYPYYLQGTSGVTYGIPYQASAVYEVYNTATLAGFFNTGSTQYITRKTSQYTYNSEYISDFSQFNGSSASVTLTSFGCDGSASDPPQADTYVAVYMVGNGTDLCDDYDPFHPILTYRVVNFAGTTLTVDKPFPDLQSLGYGGTVRYFFYYGSMVGFDLPTPENYWTNSVINFESVCYPESGYVEIWNMNIPWTENPAGFDASNLTYDEFGSRNYIGTKEYYGYQSSSGQTDTSGTSYYNSFGEEVIVTPEEQKVIAIVHYTNNTIINFFGEKFATEAYDPDNPGATGQARNFRITLPTLFWHKNADCRDQTSFYIDPPGFDGLDLLTPYYIQSTRNTDMNNPGIRYFHLYDTNPSPVTGRPNRVGKVFPDDRIIVFDDEEIVAAMSYATNRNFTLPAPRVGLVVPGSCGGDVDGILDNSTEVLWVTYGFGGPWQGMHCNYYQRITGMSGDTPSTMNVTVTFGGDFAGNDCMTQGTFYGYSANQFFVLAQRTTSDVLRPNPADWRLIDFTTTLSDAGYVDANGFIDPVGMQSLNFTISNTNYEAASAYNINNFLRLPVSDTDSELNFGDEFYFYGEIQTDIEATIYEMRYLINLPNNQFVNSSNPTWTTDFTPHMSEIGLYDSDKNLVVLSKFQSPQIREGIQQVAVKLDF
jgi:hypothetical protein